MKVGIITVAYNLPESTYRLFSSTELDMDKHDITFYLFQHSVIPETVQMCQELVESHQTNLYDYGTNRGLSVSWNEGLIDAFGSGNDVVIIANDDIQFSPGDIDKLVRKAAANQHNYMVSVAGYHAGNGSWEPSHGYSCFAVNPITLEKIGMFDQNIFPIYMEDCDHHRRATLLGLVETNCDDTEVRHEGSMAINTDQRLAVQNLVTQRKNGEYYVRKWGGINEREVFTHPFNDKGIGLRIAPEDRFHPYGPHDREDIGKVFR